MVVSASKDGTLKVRMECALPGSELIFDAILRIDLGPKNVQIKNRFTRTH
jgi:hypothetical protein